ncbi:holin family protein [uncultured Roseobacter sp.]|uniref:holin family protein n=1 Tax=uncultured Roseobacter sp. TaxID=114847 RepID=UPI00260715E2|nr:holin family protein [uncultured Roseobacter sp.]
MGLISGLLNIVFGNDRNVIMETAEVFRENSEGGAQRAQEVKLEAMQQFAAEFEGQKNGWFDRFMDGVNRIPRPALALGTMALFLAAMVDPIWFAARMQGIALVPEPLWWLLGVIVSFYFGARHQVKSQQFQRSIAQTIAYVPKVVENLASLRALRATSPGLADTGSDARLSAVSLMPDNNPALSEWRARKAEAATK